jgi:hypothetical protein
VLDLLQISFADEEDVIEDATAPRPAGGQASSVAMAA